MYNRSVAGNPVGSAPADPQGLPAERLRTLRLLLSLSLALSCLNPCYAYADDDMAQEVQNDVQEETQEEASESGGIEPISFEGQSSTYATDGATAVEGHGEGYADAEGAARVAQEIGLSSIDSVSAISPLATSSDNIGWLLGNVSGGTSVTVKVGGSNFNANNQTLYWAVLKMWNDVYQTYLQVYAANGYLKVIDTETQNTANRLSGLLNRGDTLITNTANSANRLSGLLDRGDSIITNTANAANRLSGILDRLDISNTRFSGMLERGDSISDNTFNTSNRLSGLLNRLDYALESDGYYFSFWSLGQSSSNTANRLSGVLDRLDTSNNRFSGMLERGDSITDNTFNTANRISGLLDRLNSTNEILSEIRLYTSRHVLGVDGTQDSYTLWDWLYALYESNQQLIGILDDDTEAPGTIGIDLSGVEARLDHIADLLLIAGAKDFLETIVGDFSNVVDSALLGEVQAAAQNAFPFCIPAVIKQVFGLLVTSPAAPVFDFEIGGEVLHADFAPMQGFADVLGWACRISLVFGLLLASRRFIYTGGDAA